MGGVLRSELDGTGLEVVVTPVDAIPRPAGGKRATIIRES
jgi:hypothetical protein